MSKERKVVCRVSGFGERQWKFGEFIDLICELVRQDVDRQVRVEAEWPNVQHVDVEWNGFSDATLFTIQSEWIPELEDLTNNADLEMTLIQNAYPNGDKNE